MESSFIEIQASKPLKWKLFAAHSIYLGFALLFLVCFMQVENAVLKLTYAGMFLLFLIPFQYAWKMAGVFVIGCLFVVRDFGTWLQERRDWRNSKKD